MRQFESSVCRSANSARIAWPSDSLPSFKNRRNATRSSAAKPNRTVEPSGESARQPLAKSEIATTENEFSNFIEWQFKQPCELTIFFPAAIFEASESGKSVLAGATAENKNAASALASFSANAKFGMRIHL